MSETSRKPACYIGFGYNHGMAYKPPKIPTDEVVASIRRQISAGDRGPFADMLAEALSVAPSKTALRQLARQNPRAFVSMVKELHEMAGYASRHESISIKHDVNSMALELVNRVGHERAREILSDFNLPASLVPKVPVEATSEPPPDESGLVDTNTHTDTDKV